MMFEIGDRVIVHDYLTEWGSGFVVGIFKHGALVSIDHGVYKGNYCFYFEELEKVD